MDESLERIVQEVVQRILELHGGSMQSRRYQGTPHERSVLVATEDARSAIAQMTEELRLGRTAFSLLNAGDDASAQDARFVRVHDSSDTTQLKLHVAQHFSELRLVRISLSTIARLANLVVTDPVSDLALAALAARLPVFVEPMRDRPEYLNLTQPLRSEFDTLLRKLREFGVKELSGDRSGGNAGGVGRPLATGLSPSGSRPTGSWRRVSRTQRGGQILTVTEVQDLVDPEARELVVEGGARLTDLAREYVEKHGIAVRTQA